MSRLRYKPRPYAGKIVLMTNEEWHRADPTLGWKSELVPGGMEIHAIPGDHITYMTENIQLVAAAMKDILAKAMDTSERQSAKVGTS